MHEITIVIMHACMATWIFNTQYTHTEKFNCVNYTSFVFHKIILYCRNESSLKILGLLYLEVVLNEIIYSFLPYLS